MTALLTIGTSTIRVNLLNPAGFMLSDWIPRSLDHEGVWQSSPFSPGRIQVEHKDLNILDTFELKLKQTSQDAAIRDTQTLRQILREAIVYWRSQDFWNVTAPTSGAKVRIPNAREPVYLAARGPKETNTRYAVVYDARLPTDDNPYRQPFSSIACRTSTMDDLSLVVEHGPWMANPPGESECTKASGTKPFLPASRLTWSGGPTASGDDGWVQCGGYAANLTTTYLTTGMNPLTSCDTITGIRFPGVNIPQGAKIYKAWIVVVAAFSDSGNPTRMRIYGNDVDDASQFSNGDDLFTRALTTESVEWPAWWAKYFPSWTAGTSYTSPDLTPVIQEIIDRDGWVSGNALALLMHDNGSAAPGGRRFASWDHLTYTEPTLYIRYKASDIEYGQEATCLNNVFTGNKENMANISHVYRNESVAGWSANLLANYPYDMFVNPVVDQDAVYFGCDTSRVDSGPFCSLVFDVGATRLTYSLNALAEWEYYNGAAWVALNEWDNTDPSSGQTHPFSTTGVKSVHWDPASAWAPVNLNTLFGGAAPSVTAYWVRVIATVGGGESISGPVTQQNRDVYTVTWSHAEVNADQSLGDLGALLRIRTNGCAAKKSGYFPYSARAADRLFIGIRSTTRGDLFRPYINFAEDQNETGVYVESVTDAAFVADATLPANEKLVFTPSGTSERTVGSITLAPWMAPQYYGTFRAFARVTHTAGTTAEFSIRLRWHSGWSGFEQESDLVNISNTGRCFVADFGRVTIPPSPMLTGQEAIGNIVFSIRATTAALPTAGTLALVDLILIPADEWIGEFEAPPDPNGYTVRNMGWNRILDVDSLGNPKRLIRAPLVVVSDDTIASQWICRSTGPALLTHGETQRLYFFATKLAQSDPEYTARVQLLKNDRYFSMRGDL